MDERQREKNRDSKSGRTEGKSRDLEKEDDGSSHPEQLVKDNTDFTGAYPLSGA